MKRKKLRKNLSTAPEVHANQDQATEFVKSSRS